ncbi:MAG TPA: hypothetical protein VGY48_35380 [Vicinamibacterales bacterium]|nr:hypothetical protein [Vicinamibacterales bacterium]
MSAKVLGAIVGGCLFAALPAAAQTAGRPADSSARADAETRQQRYQIGVLERVLEGAVEHGLTIIRDRMQAIAQTPTDLLLSDNAHARGFMLDGYGVFFDVTVPSFETTWWTLRTLDQNDLGLDSAMKELQTLVKNSGSQDAAQALKRVELQVTPATLARTAGDRSNSIADPREATGSTASIGTDQATAPRPAADPILVDPSEAYRAEVLGALKDAMLDHSSSLGIGPNEWLTIAARGNDDRPRLAPADTTSRTRIIRLRGADLTAYLARQITKEEALERIEVRSF